MTLEELNERALGEQDCVFVLYRGGWVAMDEIPQVRNLHGLTYSRRVFPSLTKQVSDVLWVRLSGELVIIMESGSDRHIWGEVTSFKVVQAASWNR